MNKSINPGSNGNSLPSRSSSDAIDDTRYILRLFVIGTTPRSTKAVTNIRKICEDHLNGRYELEVVDIAAHPESAKDEQIIAAPTLIKKLPLPLRRFIGDMSHEDRILVGLDIQE